MSRRTPRATTRSPAPPANLSSFARFQGLFVTDEHDDDTAKDYLDASMPEVDDDAEDITFCKEELQGGTSAETWETAMANKGESGDVLDRDGLERSEDEKGG